MTTVLLSAALATGITVDTASAAAGCGSFNSWSVQSESSDSVVNTELESSLDIEYGKTYYILEKDTSPIFGSNWKVIKTVIGSSDISISRSTLQDRKSNTDGNIDLYVSWESTGTYVCGDNKKEGNEFSIGPDTTFVLILEKTEVVEGELLDVKIAGWSTKSSLDITLKEKDGFLDTSESYWTDRATPDSDNQGLFEVTNTIDPSRLAENKEAKLFAEGGDVENLGGVYTIDITEKDNNPTAKFEIKDKHPEPGEKISVDASASSDDNGITNFKWDVTNDGAIDGDWGDDPTGWVRAGTPGQQEIRLVVEDTAGNTDSVVKTVDVNHLPSAKLDIENRNPTVPIGGSVTVTVDPSGSNDNADDNGYLPDGAATLTLIDPQGNVDTKLEFDGDRPGDLQGLSPGTWTVKLTVEDNHGGTDTATKTITVSEEDKTDPSADAGATQTVNVGDSVTLNGERSSDNVEVTKYQWDVDNDGDFERSGSSISLSYDTPGERQITLRVEDAAGNTDTDTVTVEVNTVDSDGDGIPDYKDEAPNEEEDKDGFQDGDGVPDPDNDGDGIPDSEDAAPNKPEDKDGVKDGDGKPEEDADGDGIPDEEDEAPLEPEDKDGVKDGDGVPEEDADGDGIPDEQDEAPLEPEDKDGVQDQDGDPEEDADGDGIPDEQDEAPLEPEDKDGVQDEDGVSETDPDGDGIPDEEDEAPLEPEDMDGVQDEDGDPESDADGDGIPDEEDGAPLKPEDKDGDEDQDGIPDITNDSDGDGIPDSEDAAPNEPEDKDGVEDEDGKPEVDADDDGIPDEQDEAPLKPEDKDGVQDEDGVPEEDADGDGIPDEEDGAPLEPEDKDGFEDGDGVPDPNNGNDVPSISLTANKSTVTTPVVGETVELNASGSSDPNGDSLTYSWDLDGDGQYDDAEGAVTTVAFDTAGDHTVSVEVSDGTATATKSITIPVESESQSNASISATREMPSSAQPGQTVSVTVEIQVDGEVNGLALGEDVQSLDITGQSTSPKGTFKESEDQWLWLTAENQTVVVDYTIQVPEDASIGTTYSISGTVSTSSINPSGVSGDTELTVQRCVASSVAGSDKKIGIREIQRAINSWAEGDEVAGKKVDLRKIQRLINTWSEGNKVSCGGA